MIPYVEIRDKYALEALTPIEPQECWFELSYQDVGEFEIYCKASPANLRALQKGRYVTIPNKRFIWVITSVRYTFTAGGARMILAKGYEAKWLLHKRCILTPKELQGNITRAVYELVDHALGTGASAARTISDNKGNNKFFVDTDSLIMDLISTTQAPRGNLLEFVNHLLKQYDCGSIVEFVDGVLKYRIFKGSFKQGVRFSQSLDNLLSSEYLTDDANKGTYALVVSKVETEQEDGNKKDVEYSKEYNNGATGVDRAEIFTESNLSTKYEDANGEEKETAPESALYQGWLLEEAKNKLIDHITTEEINGEIDITNSMYVFDKDFFIGDTVRIQDDIFNFFANSTISKYTFKQDANSYGEEAEYGGK